VWLLTYRLPKSLPDNFISFHTCLPSIFVARFPPFDITFVLFMTSWTRRLLCFQNRQQAPAVEQSFDASLAWVSESQTSCGQGGTDGEGSDQSSEAKVRVVLTLNVRSVSPGILVNKFTRNLRPFTYLTIHLLVTRVFTCLRHSNRQTRLPEVAPFKALASRTQHHNTITSQPSCHYALQKPAS
jgi:hypothetical protein